MSDEEGEVIDITAVEVEEYPDTRPVHWADGSFDSMAMGVVDDHPSLAYFTKCGVQVGTDDPIRVTDNGDDVTCLECA